MRKKVTLLIIAVLYSYRLFSQVSDQKKISAFYDHLINEIGIDKQVPIFNHTSLTVIRRVDLKDNKLIWTNHDKTRVTLGDSVFLNQIDINKFSERVLSEPIGIHPFTNKMHEGLNSYPKHFLALSPIIYSKDKQLAICSVYDWSGPESSSETIYLLAYISNNWKIIAILGVSIS